MKINIWRNMKKSEYETKKGWKSTEEKGREKAYGPT